jgi:HJR/Mrr/RecB family endonuclease
MVDKAQHKELKNNVNLIKNREWVRVLQRGK